MTDATDDLEAAERFRRLHAVPSPLERTGEILSVVPGRSDREISEEIRQRINQVVRPLLDEMTSAKALGFDVLLSIQTDAQGKSFLSQLKIVKEF